MNGSESPDAEGFTTFLSLTLCYPLNRGASIAPKNILRSST
jgi:hypothetical protein